ncbi:Holliday junction resolvase RuvX [Candidatus Sumerlaeota bacterium]|nr:Holliday junction resolvase RuvX [Candidatus Sumerlaeales bacterium]NLD61448.1 Holliday junction resolvase RuvX [Candidatus Sumerlaeota bacterium]
MLFSEKYCQYKVLGVDPGAVRVGIAVSDTIGMLARPLCVLDRRKPAPAARVADVARREGVRVIVVGLPLNSDGSEGPAAIKARWFADKIRQAIGSDEIQVILWDERYTSVDAAELQEQAGAAKHSHGVVDDWAAALILQSWLDESAKKRPSNEG